MQKISAKAMQRIRTRTMQRICARTMQRIRARTMQRICEEHAKDSQDLRSIRARTMQMISESMQKTRRIRKICTHTHTSLLPNCSERHFRDTLGLLGILLLKKLGHEKVPEKSAISAKNQTTLYFSLSNCNTVYLKKKSQFQQTGGRKA